MTRTWFYSEHQEQEIRNKSDISVPKFHIEGKQYTEQMGGPGLHKSIYDDAVIVHQVKDLDFDRWWWEMCRVKVAINIQ